MLLPAPAVADSSFADEQYETARATREVAQPRAANRDWLGVNLVLCQRRRDQAMTTKPALVSGL